MPSPTTKKKRVEFRATVDVLQATPDQVLSDITDTNLNHISSRTSHTIVKESDAQTPSTKVLRQQPKTALPGVFAVNNLPVGAPLSTPPSTIEAEAVEKRVQARGISIISGWPSSSATVQTHASAAISMFESNHGRATAQRLAPALTIHIQGPIYITRSLTTHEHVIRYLQTADLDSTFSSKRFVRSLSSTLPRERHMVLVDSMKQHEATADIQRLCRLLRANTTSKSDNVVEETASVLIFDLHVLDTEFGRSGFAVCDATILVECEKYFCGVLGPSEDFEQGRQCRLRPKWDLSLSEALFG